MPPARICHRPRPWPLFLGVTLSWAVLGCDPSPPVAGPSTTKTKSKKAESQPLVQLSASIATNPDGDQAELVVNFDVAQGWHIYWENPGDSGLPTKIKSPNLKLGHTLYPLPEIKRDAQGAVSYGYTRKTQLFAEIEGSLPSSAVDVKATWLVCNAEGCIRGKGGAKAAPPAGAKAPVMSGTTLQHRRSVPKPWTGPLTSQLRHGDKHATLKLGFPEGSQVLSFLPLSSRPAVYVGQRATGSSVELDYSNAPQPKPGTKAGKEAAQGLPEWANRLGVVQLQQADGSRDHWLVAGKTPR